MVVPVVLGLVVLGLVVLGLVVPALVVVPTIAVTTVGARFGAVLSLDDGLVGAVLTRLNCALQLAQHLVDRVPGLGRDRRVRRCWPDSVPDSVPGRVPVMGTVVSRAGLGVLPRAVRGPVDGVLGLRGTRSHRSHVGGCTHRPDRDGCRISDGWGRLLTGVPQCGTQRDAGLDSALKRGVQHGVEGSGGDHRNHRGRHSGGYQGAHRLGSDRVPDHERAARHHQEEGQQGAPVLSAHPWGFAGLGGHEQVLREDDDVH